MAAVRSEFGRAGVAGEGTAGSVGTTTAEKREGNGYGLVALATVVFDIDSGQRLDSLHPTNCGLTDDAKKSIAHLALPHSNNQDEGDTQFLARFRNHPEEYACAGLGDTPCIPDRTDAANCVNLLLCT